MVHPITDEILRINLEAVSGLNEQGLQGSGEPKEISRYLTMPSHLLKMTEYDLMGYLAFLDPPKTFWQLQRFALKGAQVNDEDFYRDTSARTAP